MQTQILGKADKKLQQIQKALERYTKSHPQAEVVLRRQNPVTVWIRVIDPDFEGMNRADRHTALWAFTEKLPDDVVQDISMLLPLTPHEAKMSQLSREFDANTPDSV